MPGPRRNGAGMTDLKCGGSADYGIIQMTRSGPSPWMPSGTSRMSKIKVFVLYHKESVVYRSDCFEPMQTGCAIASCDLGLLRDDTGDNISRRNGNYAELSGNYWVWKNYLPAHPEVEYIGFCHYRRFLEFDALPRHEGMPFVDLAGYRSFAKGFSQRYAEARILPRIAGADIVLPGVSLSGSRMEEVFCTHHPAVELHRLKSIIARDWPDYVPALEAAMEDRKAFLCLNYVMRRDCFESFMAWMFDILFKLERESDWSGYHEYMDEKVAAYLAEVFFNVWLHHACGLRDLKLLQCNSFLLCPDEEVHWYGPALFQLRLFATAVRSLFDGTFCTRVSRRLEQWRQARALRARLAEGGKNE